MQAFNFWLKIPKDKFQIIKEISELTNTGCFMYFPITIYLFFLIFAVFRLDELQNLGEPRKAIGMHQAVDSIASTINAANYAGCNALEKCLKLDHSKVIILFILRNRFKLIFQAGSIYIEQMMQFYRGQGSEIYWRDNYMCPTEEEYKKMCIRSRSCSYCL
jgi:geranylgeranyl diphosphate synthase type 3